MIAETYGMPVEAIRRGICHAVRKVSIGTDIHRVMTGKVRRQLAEACDDFDPRKFLAAAISAAREVCPDRMIAFGCAGQAPCIHANPVSVMAQRYTTPAATQAA